MTSLFHRSKRAKKEVPTTYEIDWWPDQKAFKIVDFKVAIIDSTLNLTNRKSLLSYTITVEGEKIDGFNINLKTVHLNERFDVRDECTKVRILEISPIAHLKEGKGENIVRFTNQILINSIQWGPNPVRFVCGSFERELVLNQSK